MAAASVSVSSASSGRRATRWAAVRQRCPPPSPPCALHLLVLFTALPSVHGLRQTPAFALSIRSSLSLSLSSSSTPSPSLALHPSLRPFSMGRMALSCLPKRSRRHVPAAMAMRWASALSEPQPEWSDALAQAVERLDWVEEESPPGLAFLFVSQAFASSLKELMAAATRELSPNALVGVVGAGVLADGRELDSGEGALGVLAGSLPVGTAVRPFVMGGESLPVWSQLFGEAEAGRPGFLLFADPFSPILQAIECLDLAWPSSVVAGGLSCPTNQASPSLALYTKGAAPRVLPIGSVVGLGIRGPHFELHSAVAQGAIGVGRSFVVTAGEDETVAELDGVPALARLQEVVDEVKSDERIVRLIQRGLMVGVRDAANEDAYNAATDDDDFLIRQVLGATKNGGLVIGDRVRAGTTRLRFHVRDEEAASDDLRLLLSRYNLNRQFAGRFAAKPGERAPLPSGALLFACNGRGTNMFSPSERPAHDSTMVRKMLGGAVPLGGFFCNGEIGPVGVAGISDAKSRAQLHGFTAVVAMMWDTSQRTEADASADTSIESEVDES